MDERFYSPLSGIGTYYSYIGIFALVVILPLTISTIHHKHKVKLELDNLSIENK